MQSNPAFRFVADAEGVGWLHIPSGRRLPIVAGAAEDAAAKKPPAKPKAKDNGDESSEDDTEQFDIPEDLSSLDDDELAAITDKAVAALDRMADEANAEGAPAPTGAFLQAATDLSGAIQDMKAEQESRAEAAAERRRQFDAAVAAVRPTAESDPEGEPEGDEGDDDGDDEPEQPDASKGKATTDADASTDAAVPNWVRARDQDRANRANRAKARGDNP